MFKVTQGSFVMKHINLIVLAVTGFILISCSENGPTEVPSDQGIREIHIYNIQDNKDITLTSEVGRVNSFDFVDNSSIYFTNVYSYGVPNSGFVFAESVNKLFLDSRSSSVLYNAPTYIYGLNNVSTNSFVLETDGDIYKLGNDGTVVTNLTSSTTYETAGVLDNISSDLFIGTKDLENNQIFKQNLLTNQKTVLINSNFNYLFPLHLNQNKTKLIYFEQNCISAPNRGYIKVIDLQNPNNKTTLAECSITALLNLQMSDNDKLVYSSDGRIYLIDVSTSDLKLISHGNSVDISKDGSKIVYSADGKSIYLLSLSSNENNLITTGNLDYAYTPRFSPDGQKIIYITSDFNIYE